MKNNLGKIITALVTPFNKKNEINYSILKKLIEIQIDRKIKTILILGTTGEGSSLSFNEKKKVIKFVCDNFKDKINIMCNIGCNNTFDSLKLGLYAESCKVDYLLVVTPYYIKPNQNGLYEHYKFLNNNLNTPLFIYNIPYRTGVNIEYNTIFKLSKLNNIVGIKEANNEQIDRLLFYLNDFLIYSGNDYDYLNNLKKGIKGIISVSSNLIPDYLVIDDNFNEFHQSLFLDSNPLCIKYLLNKRGYDVGNARMPLGYLDNEVCEKLDLIYEKYYKYFI